MVSLEEIKKNIQMTAEDYKRELKESTKNIVDDDHKFFATSDFDLNLRLEGLTVTFSSIFDDSIFDYRYNGLKNEIIINKKYLKRTDVNFYNLYMDMALNILYYNSDMKMSGFGSENYEALNKGFREIIVKNVTELDRSTEYFESDEYVYANLLSRVFDLSTLWFAYTTNDVELFRNELSKRNIEFSEQFNKINEIANRNYKVRNNKKEVSTLDDIEYSLFTLKVLDNPTQEELDKFMANMVSSSKIFKDEKKYKRLDRLNMDIEYKNYIDSLVPEQHIK